MTNVNSEYNPNTLDIFQKSLIICKDISSALKITLNTTLNFLKLKIIW